MSTRTFLALELSEAIRDRLVEAQRQLAGAGEGKVNWVAPENLHLTLRFLGDIEDRDVAEVCRRVDGVARQAETFDVEVAGIEAVPPRRPLRLFWSGVREPTGRLTALHDAAREALAGIGKDDRRPYRPHVTIGRVKRTPDAEAFRRAAELLDGQVFGACRPEEVTVFASELRRGGAVYAPLARCPIGVKHYY